MKVYTKKDWKRDGILNIQVGQEVSNNVVNQLINGVPPAYYNLGVFQLGEPHCADAEKPGLNLFDTFTMDGSADDHIWVYRGHCLYGKTEHRESWYERYKRENQAA